MKTQLGLGILLALLVASTSPVGGDATPPPECPRASSYLTSLLWTQTAAEHEALCRQAYTLAKHQLEVGLANPCWTADVDQLAAGGYSRKAPAVILDIDETVLDNAPVNAQLTLDFLAKKTNDDEMTDAAWLAWTSAARARAIPGALRFLNYARCRGAAVFFVTNREDKEAKATRENLKALGFDVDEAHLLTKNEAAGRPSEKQSRRASVAARHRIVLLIGDDFGDFLAGIRGASLADRAQAVERYGSYIGDRWIFLPNPIYGSWTKQLGKPNERAKHLVGFEAK